MQLKTSQTTIDMLNAEISFGDQANADIALRDNCIQASFSAPDNFTIIQVNPDSTGHPQVSIFAFGDRIPGDDDDSPDLSLSIGNQITSNGGGYCVIPFSMLEEIKWFAKRAQIMQAVVMGGGPKEESLRDQQKTDNQRAQALLRSLGIAEKA